MKPSTAFATLLLSLTVSAWLAQPSRNQHGNPDLEELLGTCKTDGRVIARLYEGNGGATTSYWYSVTLEGEALGKEKQIFFSYASPRLHMIECIGDSVVLQGEGFSRPIQATEFQTLREVPTQYWSGKQENRGIQPSRVIAITVAAVMAIAGIAIMVFALVEHRRRTRNAA